MSEPQKPVQPPVQPSAIESAQDEVTTASPPPICTPAEIANGECPR